MSAPAVPDNVGGAAFALRAIARHMHPDDARHVTKVLDALERQTVELAALRKVELEARDALNIASAMGVHLGPLGAALDSATHAKQHPD